MWKGDRAVCLRAVSSQRRRMALRFRSIALLSRADAPLTGTMPYRSKPGAGPPVEATAPHGTQQTAESDPCRTP